MHESEGATTPGLAAAATGDEAGPRRCLVDGYNLGLTSGTGVKTYARNLAEVLTDAGYAVDLLFGRPVARRRSPDGVAAHFFSREELPVGRRARIISSLRGFTAGRAFTVESDGRVSIDQLDDPLPRHDRLLNGYRLFDRAQLWFRLTGRRLMIRLENPPAIAHWTYPLPIGVAGAINIYTIHDLIPLTHPWTSSYDKVWFERLLRHLTAKADHLVAVSETMREEIKGRFGVADPRITTTYQSVSPQFRPRQDFTLIETALRLQPQTYFLFVSAIEPHKNLWRVIQAHSAMKTTAPLVVVGRAGLGADGYLSSLGFRPYGPLAQRARLPNGARLLWIRRAPLPLLLELMAGARALVQPSLVEGFGLPAVEAMQCGTPVITSNHPATAEIVGEAALTVDPTDVGALIQAMTVLDGDEAARRRLSDLGRQRSGFFSTQRYAEAVTGLYRDLLAGRNEGRRAARRRLPGGPPGPAAGVAREVEKRRQRVFARHFLLHTHIEKTGGSSLVHGLATLLGAEHVADLRGQRQAKPARMSRQERAAVWLLSGHFKYGDHLSLMRREPLPIALTRDPLERFFSYYRFVRAAPAHPQHATLVALSFDAAVARFLAEGRATARENMSLKILGKQPDSWDALLERVEKDYFLVLPQSAVDRALALFWRVLGDGTEPAPVRRNIGEPQAMVLSATNRAAFDDANALDRRLHDHASERADARLAEAERRLLALI